MILSAELLIGFGMGAVMAPSMNYATHGVQESESGVASAMVNTAQQIGASIGTALLNTIATSATAPTSPCTPRARHCARTHWSMASPGGWAGAASSWLPRPWLSPC